MGMFAEFTVNGTVVNSYRGSGFWSRRVAGGGSGVEVSFSYEEENYDQALYVEVHDIETRAIKYYGFSEQHTTHTVEVPKDSVVYVTMTGSPETHDDLREAERRNRFSYYPRRFTWLLVDRRAEALRAAPIDALKAMNTATDLLDVVAAFVRFDENNDSDFSNNMPRFSAADFADPADLAEVDAAMRRVSRVVNEEARDHPLTLEGVPLAVFARKFCRRWFGGPSRLLRARQAAPAEEDETARQDK